MSRTLTSGSTTRRTAAANWPISISETGYFHLAPSSWASTASSPPPRPNWARPSCCSVTYWPPRNNLSVRPRRCGSSYHLIREIL